jgi:hypothetical protein
VAQAALYRPRPAPVPQRREYDSTDDFDDSLPTECAPADFYKVFGAAFRRNGRWSTNQPVPDLGDDNTPMEQVGGGRRGGLGGVGSAGGVCMLVLAGLSAALLTDGRVAPLPDVQLCRWARCARNAGPMGAAGCGHGCVGPT